MFAKTLVRFPSASLRSPGAENLPKKTGFVESQFFEKNRGLNNWVVSDLRITHVFGAGAAKGALWKSNKNTVRHEEMISCQLLTFLQRPHGRFLKHSEHLKLLAVMLGIRSKFELSFLPHSRKLISLPGVNGLHLK